MHDVLDCDLVRRFVRLFDEQLHGVDLLLGLLGSPLRNHLSYCSVIVIVTIIEQLFVIAEENITNDRVDNVNRDDEFDRIHGQIHVLVQSVDALHLVLEVFLFFLVKQRLVGGPQLGMLLQMAMIVEGCERLCEIFDGRGYLSFAARTTANLHIVSAFVDAKKALHNHISFGILRGNLQAKLQGMLDL